MINLFKKILVTFLLTVMILSSIYTLWGWLTISDLHKYCQEHSLNYEVTIDEMLAQISDINYTVSNNKDSGFNVVSQPTNIQNPFLKFLFPFELQHLSDKKCTGTAKEIDFSFNIFRGAILEPFLAVTEKTANALFCLSIGYLVGILAVGVRFLKKTDTTYKYILVRPIIGALGAMLCYIIIISGGALIWNQVSGEKGLSVGVISVIGSIYVEKFM